MRSSTTDVRSSLLEAAFDHAGVALCLVAPDGTVLRVNAEWARSTGIPREAAVGSDVLELFPEVRELTAGLHARARAGETVQIPRHATRSGDAEVWWEGHISPVPVEGGVALLVTSLDVTADVRRQRATEEAVLAREAFLRKVIDLAPSLIFVKDRAGRFVLANAALARCYGTTTAEVVGKTDADLAPDPAEVSAYLRADRVVMDTLTPIAIPEERVRHADGEVRWYSTVKVPLVGDDGRCDEVLGVATDVTERRRAEESLHESEERFRLLAHAMPQIVCVLAPDGAAEYVNPSWESYSGLDLAATRAAGWSGVLHPDDLAAARACRLRALKLRVAQQVELRYRAADGSFRWYLSRLAPVVDRDRVVRLVGAAMEIEDRKRAEQVLVDQLALKDQLAKVAASVPGVVCSFRLGADGHVSMPFSAPGIVELYGFSQEELARDMGPAFARTHPDDLRSVQEGISASARTMTPWRGEFRYDHPVRGLRWLSGASVPSREPDGGTVWHGYVADVTEAHAAADALRRSEEQFRHLADAIPQLVWINLPDGRVVYFNRHWREYVGIAAEAPDPDVWTRALHPDDLDRTMQRWSRSLRTGEPYEIEYRMRFTGSGAYEWFLARALPVRDEDGRIARWFGTCTQIHEQKRVEEALLAAKREVGEIAERLQEEHQRKDEFLGMLSHELRNPLAPIRTSVFVLRRSTDPAQAARALQVIDRQTTHLTRLVDDLLDVTRIARGKIQLRRERVDLREIVRRTAEDFRAALEDQGVGFRVGLPADPLWLHADGTRLAQVLGNLLHNARKFTRRGDVVSVTAAARGPDAHLVVEDSGAGIDPALLPRIFDAFVQSDRTLARTEGGLGLGLALVKGIAELHGGGATAESEGRGRGARFTVVLPLAGGAGARAAPVPDGAPSAGGDR